MLNKYNYEKKHEVWPILTQSPNLNSRKISQSKQSHNLVLKKKKKKNTVHLLNRKPSKLLLGKGYSVQSDDLGFHQINVTRYAL